MRLTLPEIEIDENTGFAPDIDIFDRAGYGEALANLVTNTTGPLVVALDADWGQGKTTFVKMWMGLLKSKAVPYIYFDAFENDYQADPFLAISSELYEVLAEDSNTQEEFKKKAIPAIKAIARSGAKLAIRVGTSGLLDGSIIEHLGAETEAAGEAVDLFEKALESRLESGTENKAALSAFKEFLSQKAADTGVDKPLIFIVDELDRCKPDFALSLLEVIKHFFSTDNIVFLLVMNRDQMEEAVRCRYGRETKATKYLMKFVNLWTSLPRPVPQHLKAPRKFARHCLESMGMECNTNQYHGLVEDFINLIEHYSLGLREIERAATNMAIIDNATQSNLRGNIKALIPFVAVLKVVNPSVYRALSEHRIDYESLIKIADLERLKHEGWENLDDHYIKQILRYELTPDELIDRSNFNDLIVRDGEHYKHASRYLCGILDSFT